jgi:hypothetical protein
VLFERRCPVGRQQAIDTGHRFAVTFRVESPEGIVPSCDECLVIFGGCTPVHARFDLDRAWMYRTKRIAHEPVVRIENHTLDGHEPGPDTLVSRWIAHSCHLASVATFPNFPTLIPRSRARACSRS